MGVVGMILLFGAGIALIFTPGELLILLLVPMILGLMLLMFAYLAIRKSERAVFEQGHASHSPRSKP